MAAPWVQAIGRLRCVVQGCCHGAPCHAALGLRISRPESRVVRLAKLGGVPVHPTPVYSIAANLAIGLLLLRLWNAGSPPGMLAGVYFLLNGFARFVEEAYRGEPQTPFLAGLRLYQWLAVASVGGGACLMVAGPSTVLNASPPGLAWMAVSLAFGGLCGFVMGIDFPGSTRRFSRLA
jgi:prolipoprotein diacylglyceryltransferase